MVDKAVAEEIMSGPTAGKASVCGAKTDQQRGSSFGFGKESFRSKHSSAPDHAWRREWELETELHQVKLKNSTYQEQMRILTLERDAAEAELHETQHLSTCLRKDFEDSAELLNRIKPAVKDLHRRTVELEIDTEQKDKEIQYILADRDSMAVELIEVTNDKNTLECEVQDLRTENRGYESWMDKLTIGVQDMTASHANLESKLQVSEDIIHELHKVIKNDSATSEMNRKALLRKNADLKREVDTLNAKLKAEHERISETESNVDWKQECVRVHKQKSIELEQMQARLHEKTSENARLKLQSSAHLRALEVLEAEQAASAASGPMYNSTLEGIHESLAEGYTISCATMIAEIEPTNDGQVDQPTSLMSDHTISARMHKRQEEHTGSPAQVLIILLCLLAALFSRLI